MKSNLTTLFLHSEENRLRYPPSRYALTHTIYNQAFQLLLVAFKRLLFIIFVIILFISFLLNVHTHFYNYFFGPFYLNSTEFEEHVENFKHGRHKFEYIQIEIGVNNKLQNHFSAIEETYTKLKTPDIYIQMPSEINSQLRIDFLKFSNETLECVWKTASGMEVERKMDRNDLITYAKTEYHKNPELFNSFVFKKCGIFVGFCKYDTIINGLTWMGPQRYLLGYTGVVFDANTSYFPFFSSIALSICFIAYLFVHRYILQKTYFSDFPLAISDWIQVELQRLGYNNIPPHEQSLKLDEHINNSDRKYKNQVFIIKNIHEEYFVVVLFANRDEILTFKYLPFVIYSAENIFDITGAGIQEIENVKPRVWWPATISSSEVPDCAGWLHTNLVEISQRYRQLVDERLAAAEQKGIEELTVREEKFRYDQIYQNPEYLKSLDNEEERNEVFVRLYNILFEIPVSPREFATFWYRNCRIPKIIDEALQNDFQNRTCPSCQEDFVLNQEYAIWPCSSSPPHYFHCDCIIKHLIYDKRCPVCRQPAIVD